MTGNGIGLGKMKRKEKGRRSVRRKDKWKVVMYINTSCVTVSAPQWYHTRDPDRHVRRRVKHSMSHATHSGQPEEEEWWYDRVTDKRRERRVVCSLVWVSLISAVSPQEVSCSNQHCVCVCGGVSNASFTSVVPKWFVMSRSPLFSSCQSMLSFVLHYVLAPLCGDIIWVVVQ